MANRKYGREKDEKRSEGGGGISKLGKLSDHVAYRFVQSLAIRSCSSRFWRYCVAILPTKGSAKNFTQLKTFRKRLNFYNNLPGLQSVNSEHIESKTLEMVKAGDQLSFKISKQITPWLFMLQ